MRSELLTKNNLESDFVEMKNAQEENSLIALNM
jgi:hypothetical protein